MALVKEIEASIFDTASVKTGDLMYVEYTGWNAPKRGIVMYVSCEKIVLLYHPEIPNVTNRQEIFAKDVAEGKFVIRWSSDLTEICQYPEPEPGPEVDVEPDTEPPAGMEGNGNDA